MLTVQRDLDNLIRNLQNNKYISHAYIIEKNNYSGFNIILNQIIKSFFCKEYNDNCVKCPKCTLIDNNIYDDLVIINPDGSWIKKEQLISLQKSFQTTSYNGDKRLYIINDAEKLTSSSANTILKFLEEPPENVHAILITNNRYQMIPTILSRCQIIKIINNEIEEEQKEKSKIVYDFLDILNIYKTKSIAYIPIEIRNEFLLKEKAESTYEILFNVLYLQFKNGNYNLSEHLETCLECQKLLKNNINLNLLLDKLIIGLSGGINNEI